RSRPPARAARAAPPAPAAPPPPGRPRAAPPPPARRAPARRPPPPPPPGRPEGGGRAAPPRHEFGLDVVALAGTLRYREHKSVPEIHRDLLGRGLAVSQRSVTNLLDRYDELLAVALADDARLNRLLDEQGKAVLALAGLPADVGQEVVWVLRACLSGEILLARSLLSARQQDLAELLGEVRDALAVPVAAVVSDGQRSIRKAVAEALPGVPHQLCHFHYL